MRLSALGAMGSDIDNFVSSRHGKVFHITTLLEPIVET